MRQEGRGGSIRDGKLVRVRTIRSTGMRLCNPFTTLAFSLRARSSQARVETTCHHGHAGPDAREIGLVASLPCSRLCLSDSNAQKERRTVVEGPVYERSS